MKKIRYLKFRGLHIVFVLFYLIWDQANWK